MKPQMKQHRAMSGASVAAPCVLLFVFLLAADQASAATYDTEQFEARKRRALAPLAAQMSRIVESHRDDPAFELFLKRLKLIDEVSLHLIGSFQQTKSSTLDDILTDVVPLPRDAAANPQALMNAGDLIAQYKDPFAAGLPLPSVDRDDMEFLRKYYDASTRAAMSYVADRGRVFAAIDEERAAGILQLCLVMPFLHIPDETWSIEEVTSLPEWMRSSRNLRSAEDFALLMRRPVTAYQMAVCRRAQEPSEPTGELTYVAYLKQAAERMIEKREYHAGIHCLRVGIERGRETEKTEVIVALRFQLAEVLSRAGHSQLSAEEIKHILDDHPESPEWGKAAMLRLKYLYDAAQFDRIIEEFNGYRHDDRCVKYLPQIVYITWVTYRRGSNTAEADRLKDFFLEKYSRHPLAADMHFASAMTALAASDYDEALRSLEIIEYRYPRSRIARKAKEIRRRLEKTLGSGAGKAQQ